MISWLERQIGWIAFPSIIRYLAYFQLGVLVLSFINPTTPQLLEFNWEFIIKGEYWRLLSYIVIPIGALTGSGGALTAVFSVIAAMLLMTFSDGIEAHWGSFRTTLYVLVSWMFCTLASILTSTLLVLYTPTGVILPPIALSPGMLFDYAIFFAFATFYPKYELRMFFVLPVPISIIAGITGVVLLVTSLSGLPFVVYILLGLAPYLLVLAQVLKGGGARIQHKIKHAARKTASPVLYTCVSCGVTDQENGDLIFRVTKDGEDKCENCMKN